MKITPLIKLAGCAIVENDKILLLKRIKTGWFELPGGKLEEGESPDIAAKREILEELLVHVEILKELGIKEFTENGYVMEYTWFKAIITENETPKIGEPEKFSDLKYIPIKDLSTIKLSPNMNNLLEEINAQRISLNKIQIQIQIQIIVY